MPRYAKLSPSWKENEFLHRTEIKHFGKGILNTNIDSKSLSNFHPDLIFFLLKCMNDLVYHQKCFKFSPRQKKDVITMLSPYKKKFLRIADAKKRGQHVKQIQKGRGILTSALIAAVAPLIVNLVKKAVKAFK
ncbi:MAG: hypothetical protein AAFR83_20865 [Cyanobacteria bacterium J06629_18]